jgi:hypothetical protein
MFKNYLFHFDSLSSTDAPFMILVEIYALRQKNLKEKCNDSMHDFVCLQLKS